MIFVYSTILPRVWHNKIRFSQACIEGLINTSKYLRLAEEQGGQGSNTVTLESLFIEEAACRTTLHR